MAHTYYLFLSSEESPSRTAEKLCRVVTTAGGDYPHILVYFTTYSVVSCRQRFAKEAAKVSIMFEQLIEKIKNLWYTRVLGY